MLPAERRQGSIIRCHECRAIIAAIETEWSPLIFSKAGFMAPLEVFRRDGLEHVESIRTEIPCSIGLRDDNHLTLLRQGAE